MAKRILYLGNDYWKFAGVRSTGFHTRFFNGLVRAGHSVYYFSGTNEARQLAPLGLKKLGMKKATERLKRIVANFQPEAIVASYVGDYLEVLQELKTEQPHLRLAQLNVDPVFSTQNRTNLQRSRGIFHANFITTAGATLLDFATTESPFYFMPNVTDTSIDTGRAFALATPTYDLACFLHGSHQSSADQQRRIDFALRASHGIVPERLLFGGFNGHPSLYGRPYLDGIGNSAMMLNLNRDRWDGVLATPEQRYLYSSDRTAHIMGNGSLALTERGYALEELYDENEMVFFADADELAEKVTFLRAHPAERQRIAEHGWKKAHGAFNEIAVMRYVVERLFDTPLSSDYPWPTASISASIAST